MHPSNLRLATLQDIPELLKVCEEAHKESPHKLRFDPERVLASIEHLIQKGVIICLVETQVVTAPAIVGILGGLVTMTPMSLEKVAAELLWFVLPAHRKSRGAMTLLDAFEYWAWSQNCSNITLANMTNNSLLSTDKFYRRKGYTLVEQAYMKRIR